MSELTRYRRLPGYSTVGTDTTLPPGSYSSAVADWVPDTRLQAIADAWNGCKDGDQTACAELYKLLDALEGNSER